MITLPTSAGETPARERAARMAIAPSSVAESGARPPRKRPMGVLAADTITGCLLRSDMGGKLIGTLRIFPHAARWRRERTESRCERPRSYLRLYPPYEVSQRRDFLLAPRAARPYSNAPLLGFPRTDDRH